MGGNENNQRFGSTLKGLKKMTYESISILRISYGAIDIHSLREFQVITECLGVVDITRIISILRISYGTIDIHSLREFHFLEKSI
jgi:hypothetical protein